MLILVTDLADSVLSYCIIDSDLKMYSSWYTTTEEAYMNIVFSFDIHFYTYALEDWQKELPEYIVTEYIPVPLPYEYW